MRHCKAIVRLMLKLTTQNVLSEEFFENEYSRTERHTHIRQWLHLATDLFATIPPNKCYGTLSIGREIVSQLCGTRCVCVCVFYQIQK